MGWTWKSARARCSVFLGHNSAGKTTTVRLLNGVLIATAGSARVRGLDPGVLTETPSLDERLTSSENPTLFARNPMAVKRTLASIGRIWDGLNTYLEAAIFTAQALRSFLFLFACTPVIALWRGARWTLFVLLGSALFIFVGGVYMLQAYWYPVTMHIAHSLEFLAGAFAYAGVLTTLFDGSRSS